MVENVFKLKRIFVNSELKTKEELFRFISDEAFSSELINSADEFYKGLIAREEQISTEVEKGLAIPHTKIDTVKNLFVYIVTSKKGIKYGGLGSKVKISFIIGAPANAEHFLDVMAAIARLMDNKENRRKFEEGNNPEEIFEILNDGADSKEAEEKGKKDRHLIVLSLNEDEKIDTVMKLAVELGVKNLQIFDTTNASAKIAFNFPFLSILASRNNQISSKTLFGMVESNTVVSRMYAHLKAEDIDLELPGTGALFSLPISVAYGGIDADYF